MWRPYRRERLAVDDGATESGLWIGYKGALPPGFPGFTFTAWAADVGLLNFGIPSLSGGHEIVLP